MKIRLPEKDYKFIISWILLLAAGLYYLNIGILSNNLWHEETLTAAIIKHPISDICRIAYNNGQPPLYFILLKIFSDIFGYTEFTLRFPSVIGVICIAALGAGPVKRIFGKRVGFVYAFFILSTPFITNIAHEAKMYTWSIFFTTSSILYGYLAAMENRKTDWLRFLLLTVASLNIYNYAVFPAAIAMYIMLRWIFVKNRYALKRYIISAATVIIIYIPSALNFFKPMVKNLSDFIWPLDTLPAILRAFLAPFSNFYGISLYIEIPIFIISVAFIAVALFNTFINKKAHGLMISFGMAVYLITIILGAIYSTVASPVFFERISIPVMGVFIIAFSYGVSLIREREYLILICILFFIISLPHAFYISSENLSSPIEKTTEYLEKRIAPNDVFVHFDEETYNLFSYYFPKNKNILYIGNNNHKELSAYDAYYPNEIVTWFNFYESIKDYKNIWLINHPNSENYSYQTKLIYLGAIKSTESTKRFFSQIPFFDISITKAVAGNRISESIPLTSDIKVKINLLNSYSGQVIVKLFNKNWNGPFINKTGKTNDANTFATQKGSIIKNATSEVTFENIPYGNYSIFAFHDKNNNNILDFKDGKIKEGFGNVMFYNPGIFFVESEKTQVEINLIYPP